LNPPAIYIISRKNVISPTMIDELIPYTSTGPAMVNIFAQVPRQSPSASVKLGPKTEQTKALLSLYSSSSEKSTRI